MAINRLVEVNESAQTANLSDEARSPGYRRNGGEILMDTGSKNGSQYLDRTSLPPTNKRNNNMPEGLSEDDRLRAETIESLMRFYDSLDINGDGIISYKELQANALNMGEASGLDTNFINDFFSQYDSNGDGKVSKQEYREFFTKMVDEAIRDMGQQT